MNYAVIENGIVSNVVVWDGKTEWEPPASSIVVPLGDSGAGIGWTYDDGQFIAPPQAEPEPDTSDDA